jgi:hypothetical protein
MRYAFLLVLSLAAVQTPPDLVRRLGDPAFAVREQARSQLRQMGRQAEAALRAGLADADPEVRQRCRALLDEILEADRAARLQGFLEVRQESGAKSFPGWRQFSKTVGSSPAARSFFVTLYRAGPDLLEATERNPREAAGLLATQVSQLAVDLITPGKDEAAPTSLALMLLAALDNELVLDPLTLSGLGNALQILAERATLRQQFLENPAARAILVTYLRQRMSGASGERGLELAGAFELKEAADWACAVALDRGQSGAVRGRALLTLAQVGGREHARLVEPLLSDTTTVGDRNLGSSKLHAEVRDVALAACVRLGGGRIADVGFPYLQAVPGLKSIPSPTCLGFASAAQREAAFQKYKSKATGPRNGSSSTSR